MPTRTARTAWIGSLNEGGGQVELTSSKVATFSVSFPKRAADDADGTTSPEELIAAAHSSCYAMQLSALIGFFSGSIIGIIADTPAAIGALTLNDIAVMQSEGVHSIVASGSAAGRGDASPSNSKTPNQHG